jgi:hypothetical protein
VGEASGDGRLWSVDGSLVGEGRYRIFKDGSGWFACDVSNIVPGVTLQLELSTGERTPVQVSRKALRNCLFRPALPESLAPGSSEQASSSGSAH